LSLVSLLREPHLTELESTSEYAEYYTNDTSTLLELESKKMSTDNYCPETLEPINVVEVGEITRIADVENNLVEDDEDRDLYEDRETRAERIYSFFFIQFHQLHTDCRLVTFV
jgi:hypothetical protein